MHEVRTIRAGLVPYEQAWQLQRALHAHVVAGARPDTVVLLEHPAVYTAGKRTEPSERPFDGTPVVDVDRGGKITWHGPGQLVGYPLVSLPDPVDVVAYVRRMEHMLIAVCARFGVPAGQVEGRSGVWLAADGARAERKIAAIGIRIARGVTMHGFALNCDADLSAYDRFVPCGITDAGVTSLSVETGRRIGVAEVLPVVEAQLHTLFGGPVECVDETAEIAAAVTAPAVTADVTEDVDETARMGVPA